MLVFSVSGAIVFFFNPNIAMKRGKHKNVKALTLKSNIQIPFKKIFFCRSKSIDKKKEKEKSKKRNLCTTVYLILLCLLSTAINFISIYDLALSREKKPKNFENFSASLGLESSRQATQPKSTDVSKPARETNDDGRAHSSAAVK
jgi:hypothetical protein